MEKTVCTKCRSDNITYQVVANTKTKNRSIGWWIYFILFGWIIELMMWLFATIPMLLIRIFHKGKVETKSETLAICQNCGNTWKIASVK